MKRRYRPWPLKPYKLHVYTIEDTLHLSEDYPPIGANFLAIVVTRRWITARSITVKETL